MAIRPRVIQLGKDLAEKYPSYKNFLRGITSEHTKSEYINCLKNFMLYHKLEDYDAVAKLSPEEIDKLITDYLDSLVAREVKATTQRSNLVGRDRDWATAL